MDRIGTPSYWDETTTAAQEFPPLQQDIEVDTLIIGAGITGLTAALSLKQQGRSVVVIEAGRIGAGTTGKTSGHLEALPDQGLTRLVKVHGEDYARIITQARLSAIEQIEDWCAQFSIDCDFARIPAFAYSESSDGANDLRAQCETARQLGLEASPVEAINLPFATAGGLCIERQARFHSLRYLQALARQVHGEGCTIHEHTRAEPPKDGEPCIVKTAGGEIRAQNVLLSTHSAFLGISELDFRVAPYQSYVIAVSLAQEFPDALFWDDASPYHYFRRASSEQPQLMIAGGADHKTGQGEDERDSVAELEAFVRERFDVEAIEHRWSGEYFEPADGLPYAGRVPFADHLFVATGFLGTGLTYGTACGKLLADLLCDRDPELAAVVSPARIKPLASIGKVVSENLNVVRRFVVDRFGPAHIESLDEIAIGEGKLIRYEGKSYAAYRDECGAMHLLAPECTHAGCFVQWNEVEKTWDCPCHGGRFSCTGERLYGPPPKDLATESFQSSPISP